ncbi:hypothetical protein [Bacillus thuringiensis]|uniref:hypothetical protein n=1 Tax=Bacillus thuringiensis TaxID=1428 RepID=UPI001F5B76D6|nr:hypothetical protein [Bacillus thuringiensis]
MLGRKTKASIRQILLPASLVARLMMRSVVALKEKLGLPRRCTMHDEKLNTSKRITLVTVRGFVMCNSKGLENI